MFKVNNKDTRTMPMAFYCSSVSIFNFEHVIIANQVIFTVVLSYIITVVLATVYFLTGIYVRISKALNFQINLEQWKIKNDSCKIWKFENKSNIEGRGWEERYQ